jgi:uncharacterized membrane protein YqjE
MVSESYQPPSPEGKEAYDEENLLQEIVQVTQDHRRHENFSDEESHRYHIAVDVSPSRPELPELPIGQKRALFIWLIVATVINGFLFLTSLALCLMSVMFFDAGVSLQAWIAVVVVLSIPVLIIGATVSSWTAYNSRNYRLVILLNVFPSLVAITYFLAFLAS